ncbi:hypothetical protein QAD02_015547 [Eretmocerus hayati]|uniref:Uncharacterized protein n=1 Tax=Eretmocerus hayati TaxID=131215 RepID=A0ACC2P8L8_9HYME|nr:hypothetical protein QAD02_015547 [Eretmocerus hayati]
MYNPPHLHYPNRYGIPVFMDYIHSVNCSYYGCNYQGNVSHQDSYGSGIDDNDHMENDDRSSLRSDHSTYVDDDNFSDQENDFNYSDNDENSISRTSSPMSYHRNYNTDGCSDDFEDNNGETDLDSMINSSEDLNDSNSDSRSIDDALGNSDLDSNYGNYSTARSSLHSDEDTDYSIQDDDDGGNISGDLSDSNTLFPSDDDSEFEDEDRQSY